jgi:hypothetical protein
MKTPQKATRRRIVLRDRPMRQDFGRSAAPSIVGEQDRTEVQCAVQDMQYLHGVGTNAVENQIVSMDAPANA